MRALHPGRQETRVPIHHPDRKIEERIAKDRAQSCDFSLGQLALFDLDFEQCLDEVDDADRHENDQPDRFEEQVDDKIDEVGEGLKDHVGVEREDQQDHPHDKRDDDTNEPVHPAHDDDHDPFRHLDRDRHEPADQLVQAQHPPLAGFVFAALLLLVHPPVDLLKDFDFDLVLLNGARSSHGSPGCGRLRQPSAACQPPLQEPQPDTAHGDADAFADQRRAANPDQVAHAPFMGADPPKSPDGGRHKAPGGEVAAALLGVRAGHFGQARLLLVADGQAPDANGETVRNPFHGLTSWGLAKHCPLDRRLCALEESFVKEGGSSSAEACIGAVL